MADLSEDQAAVYDRQLRVWGVAVQQRLSAGRVLIVGSGCLAAEVAKNIVLAGVGNVTLLDTAPSAGQNANGNFLIPASTPAETSAISASVKTLQAMNPYITVQAIAADPATAADSAVTGRYDVVVLTSPSLQLHKEVNGACRESGTKFMGACVRGPLSFVFIDLLTHKYLVKPEDAGLPEQAGEHTLIFSSLDRALGVSGPRLKGAHPLYLVLKVIAMFEDENGHVPREDDLPAVQQYASRLMSADSGNVGSIDNDALSSYVLDVDEFAPVATVVGGVIGNEVVKAISQEKEPIKNLFFYTLLDGQGLIESR